MGAAATRRLWGLCVSVCGTEGQRLMSKRGGGRDDMCDQLQTRSVWQFFYGGGGLVSGYRTPTSRVFRAVVEMVGKVSSAVPD